ncbi:uncharacterized protein [Lepeophtheirus salmonis]|uniref:Uncharacterized protein n=1 Tax=Lepeophtheirus salmonis TaxID=72036 RepID=A0A0K2VCT0_LEPSM|nr:uncharacterized protein LOC121129646 [Lepeophtheirus salmonis]
MLRHICSRALSTVTSSNKFLESQGISELSLSSLVNDEIIQRYPQQQKIISEYSTSLHPGSFVLTKESMLKDGFVKVMKEFVPLMVVGNRENMLKASEIDRLLELIKLMCLIRLALRIHETVNEDIETESSNKKAILVGDFFLTLANSTAASLEDPEIFSFISQCSVNYIRCKFSKNNDIGLGHLIGCGLISAHRVTDTQISEMTHSTLKNLGNKFGRLVSNSCSRSHFGIIHIIRSLNFKNQEVKRYLNHLMLTSSF